MKQNDLALLFLFAPKTFYYNLQSSGGDISL